MFKEAAVCFDGAAENILLSCCLSLAMVFHWCCFLTGLIMVTVDHDLEVMTRETALPTWHYEDKGPIDQSKINLLAVMAWNLSFVKLKKHPVSSQTPSVHVLVDLGFPLLSTHWKQKGGGGGGGPWGQRINRCLHSLQIIEQISNEQLLPVKMTRFHFITMDKRSDSICMLQLSAILIRLPIPAFNISWQT